MSGVVSEIDLFIIKYERFEDDEHDRYIVKHEIGGEIVFSDESCEPHRAVQLDYTELEECLKWFVMYRPDMMVSMKVLESPVSNAIEELADL